MGRSRRRPKSSQDLRRRAAFRTEPDRVLIVTEGSKTEPAYFRMLIAELGLTTAKVSIVGDGGSAPISVVQEAEERLKQDDDFERVYCVFDRDRHASYDEALKVVKTIAARKVFRNKTVLAIPSVPCFEVWYLLHISDSRKPYEAAATGGSPAEGLIADLKKDAVFAGYDKHDCSAFYEKIAPLRDVASGRAEKFLTAAQDEGATECYENPSTRVHLVVKALSEISQKKRSEKP